MRIGGFTMEVLTTKQIKQQLISNQSPFQLQHVNFPLPSVTNSILDEIFLINVEFFFV